MRNSIVQTLTSRLRRFCRAEDGTVVVEAVLVLPTLLWVTLAMFVYWDSYRSVNIIQKATYTISDTLSRENREDPIDGAYIDGLREVMNYLLDGDQVAKIRVSSVTWKTADNDFSVLWSYSPGEQIPAMPVGLLADQDYQDKVPNLADGDTVIVVETMVDFSPAFDVGMNDLVIDEFIATRPRSGRLCFTGFACF